MMRRVLPLALILFACLPLRLNAADATFRGNVRSILAIDTTNDDAFEHFYDSNTRLFAEGRLSQDSLSAAASFKLRYQLDFPRDTQSRYNADLYEAYIRWAKGSWSIEGGERVVRWGVMEYSSPTDSINSKDLTQIVDPDVEDTYLPVPMFRAIWDLKPIVVEGIYQPFFRPSRFDLLGTDAALYRPSLTKLVGVPFRDLSTRLDDDVEDQAGASIGSPPSHSFFNGEGGGRITWTMGHLDIGAIYLSKRETVPALGGRATALLVSTSPPTGITPGNFPRNHLAGATAHWVLDNGLTLKSEFLFAPSSTVYDDRLIMFRESSLKWATGVDYDWDIRHLFTLEYAQDRLFSRSIQNYFLRDEVQHSVFGAAIFNFDARTWTVELKGTGIVNQNAYWLNPRLIYRPKPPLELALGCNFIGGETNSLFGLLSNNDQIFISGRYLF